MDWDGHRFPIATLDGDVLPDAFVHSEGLLPHLHEGLEKHFPRAKACEDAGDLDPPGEDELDERGAALGRAPELSQEKKEEDARGMRSTESLNGLYDHLGEFY